MPFKTIETGTTADAYLALLADRGVDYLFANAGTDFAPLIEALCKAEANGTPTPKPVTVPHENVAIGMALGYYLKTGKPQLVMVHVNVGTANAVAGLLNAWRANIPVLFTAGRTPFSEEGHLTGKRTGEIHWPQEMRDQRAMVREFVKWDYEFRAGQPVPFTADIVAEAQIEEVVIDDLRLQDLAGKPERCAYVVTLREHIEPTRPEDTSFLNSEILNDAQNLIDDLIDGLDIGAEFATGLERFVTTFSDLLNRLTTFRQGVDWARSQ